MEHVCVHNNSCSPSRAPPRKRRTRTLLTWSTTQETFTGITVARRIPQIIRETVSSIPNLPEEAKSQYESLACAIRDDCPLEDITSPSSLLDLLFSPHVRRAVNRKLGWYSIAWWLVENYEYLLMNHIQRSLPDPTLPRDPFFYMKQKALDSAMVALPTLLSPLVCMAVESSKPTESVFHSFILRNLWGNKADLSMSAGKVESTQSTASDALLVDDWKPLWTYIQSKSLHRVAIFADNCGLELLCDLALAALLLHVYDDLSITYFIKSDPVFVSDVTPADIEPTMAALEKHPSEGSFGVRW